MRYTFFALLMLTSFLFAQSDTTKILTKDSSLVPRNAFIRYGLGWNELFNFGIGVQFNSKVSVTLKYSLNWISNGSLFENMGEGAGIRLTYHHDIKYINSFSIEATPYLNLPTDIDNSRKLPFFKGYCIDINVGKENVYSNGNTFFVACGVSYSVVTDQQSAIGPYFKVGWNYNLFFGGSK